MVLQMGQGDDDSQDRAIIQYLSQHALAIQHHPGAVQFQVSKKMLNELRQKFSNMQQLVSKPFEAQGLSDAQKQQSKP